MSRAREGGFRVQSNFARKHAVHVARAASCGYISTLLSDGSYGPDWFVTAEGNTLLEENQ